MSLASVDPRATDRTGPTSASETPHTARLAQFLERLSRSSFYGKVLVSFQNGKVCDVKIEQTKKLDEL